MEHVRRLFGACFVAALALLMMPFPVAADEPADPMLALKSLVSDLQREDRVASVIIFHCRYDAENRTRLSPYLLERTAETRIEMQLTPTSREELTKVLGQMDLQATNQGSDLRWGIVFLDDAHRRAHSLYLNGRSLFVGAGRLGYIDDQTVAVNGPLIDWLERNFLPPEER